MSEVDSEEQASEQASEEQGAQSGGGAADASASGGVKEIARPSGGAGQKIRRYWPIGALALSTVVLIVGLALALKNTTASDPKPKPAGNEAAPQGDLVTVEDKEAGFTVKYPKDWTRLNVPPGNPDLRLAVSVSGTGPGSDDGMWVGVVPPERVDQSVIEFTEGLKAATVLRREEVTVNGMKGFRVVYITKDEASGQENVQLRYFLRRGQGLLYQVGFVAQPRSELTALAPAFDQVLSSFQTSEEPPPTPPSTAAR